MKFIKLEPREITNITNQLKNRILFREVMSVFDEEFNSEEMKELCKVKRMDKRTIWHDEYLSDLISKINGCMKKKDGKGLDFTDDTELKCVIISPFSKVRRIEITNLMTKQGYKKRGDLRLLVINPFSRKPEYYYIPCRHWYNWVLNIHRGIGRKFFNWNKKKKEFPHLKQFRINEFETWCKILPAGFKPKFKLLKN